MRLLAKILRSFHFYSPTAGLFCLGEQEAESHSRSTFPSPLCWTSAPVFADWIFYAVVPSKSAAFENGLARDVDDLICGSLRFSRK